MNLTKKSPYQILGIVFASIAAVEALIVLILVFVGSDTALIASLPLGSQCVIFGSVGIGFLVYVHRKKEKRDRLLSNGYCEMATVVAIETNAYVRVNRSSPYYVVCRIQRDGVLHEYRSESQFHYPSVQVDDLIPVYLDRQNEKDYYVDLNAVSQPVIRH